jgi:hypothetical protein
MLLHLLIHFGRFNFFLWSNTEFVVNSFVGVEENFQNRVAAANRDFFSCGGLFGQSIYLDPYIKSFHSTT